VEKSIREITTGAKSVIKKKTMKKPSAETTRKAKLGTGVYRYRGLCQTCVNAPACTFPRNVTRPVWHCEEFDTYMPSQTSKEIPSKVGPQLNSSYAKKDISQYQGLCSNCENIKSCTYPKPEGGVWHCEEYK
jgi:hypothetical protein